MRILFVHPLWDKPTVLLLDGLIKKGHYVKIYSKWFPTDISLLDRYEVEHFPICHPYDIRAARLMRQKVIEGGFDIVQVQWGKSFLTTSLALRGLRKPKIFWFRGALKKVSRISLMDRLRYFGKNLDCITTNCEAVRKALIADGIDPERLKTIYAAHDINLYQANPINLRRKLGISMDFSFRLNLLLRFPRR